MIVGAGGHNDPIRRKYWQEKSVNIPVKFELKDGDYGDAVELHFGSMAPGGYAWMFPKSEGANIGLGIQKSFANGKSLNKYSSEFIDKYDGDTTFQRRWITANVWNNQAICQRKLRFSWRCCGNGVAFKWCGNNYCNGWW